MSVTFPPGPNVGDTVADSGVVWLWDGSKWTHVPGAAGGELAPLPAGDFRTFTGPVVTWTASQQGNSLGTFTLGPGDWDVFAYITGTPQGANTNNWNPSATINGVNVGPLFPNYSNGLLWQSMPTPFRIQLATFRAFDPDAEMQIGFTLGWGYNGNTSNPTSQITMQARKWSDDGTGIVGQYVEIQPPSVSWVNSGDTNSLGTLVLPAGDWDVNGGIFVNVPGATAQGGDVNGIIVTTYIDGVAIPQQQFAPVLFGALTQQLGGTRLPLSIARAFNPNAEINVELQMQLTYANANAAAGVDGQMWLRARRWA